MAKQRYGVIKVAPKSERTDVDGTVHASKAEKMRWRELRLLVRNADIVTASRQPVFRLGDDCLYKADFLVVEWCSRQQVSPAMGWYQVDCHAEDTKPDGPPDRDFQRIKRLWKKYGPFPLAILTRKGNGWKREVIEPDTLERA